MTVCEQLSGLCLSKSDHRSLGRRLTIVSSHDQIQLLPFTFGFDRGRTDVGRVAT
jgi:hypothetical protein